MYDFCEVDLVLMLIGADSVTGGLVEIGLLFSFFFLIIDALPNRVFSKIYDLFQLPCLHVKNKCFTSLSG